MNQGLGPEEKRRIVRLVLLLVILVGTVYALLDLAERLEEAKPEAETEPGAEAAAEPQLNAAGTDG